ncbi:hypothetical protein RchiOBHm_Chr2g0121251 [Rosa chinensis]|uniref:Uncharacterized protein n=1 Tax=Rosa chinensis TaxID=74649 RepID=A0A2P6RSG0_ROSCH|nr:hypothetical protein RchiOBHm_Chr2g0121251 [Rosa chinensis]
MCIRVSWAVNCHNSSPSRRSFVKTVCLLRFLPYFVLHIYILFCLLQILLRFF